MDRKRIIPALLLIISIGYCFAGETGNKIQMAYDLSKKGVELCQSGKYLESVPLFVKAIEISKVAEPNDPNLGSAYMNLGDAYVNIGKKNEGEMCYKNALSIYNKHNIRDNRYTGLLTAIADVCYNNGKYDEAIKYDKNALQLEPHISMDRAYTLEQLSKTYGRINKYQDAISAVKDSIAISKRLRGDNSTEIAEEYCILANHLANLGKYSESSEANEMGYQILKNKYGEDSEKMINPLLIKANNYYELNELEKAKELFEKTLTLIIRYYGDESFACISLYKWLSQIYVLSGDNEKGLLFADKCYKTRLKNSQDNDIHLADDLLTIGNAYCELRNYQDAITAFDKAISIYSKNNVVGTEAIGSLYCNKGHMFSLLGDLKNAISNQETGLNIMEQLHGLKDLNVNITLNNLASLCYKNGDVEKSKYYCEQYIKSSESLLPSVLRMHESARLKWQGKFVDYDTIACVLDAKQIGDYVLHTKGIVLDSLCEDRRTLAYCANNQRSRDLYNQLEILKKQRDNNTIINFENSVKSKLNIDDKIDSIEQELSRYATAIGSTRKSALDNTAKVSELLNSEDLCLEFFTFENRLKSDDSRFCYGVIGLSKSSPPFFIRLENKASIDHAVNDFRKSISNGDSLLLEKSQKTLTSLLVTPIVCNITNNIKNLIISPDSSLNLISFSALLNPDSSFLSEKFQISYSATSRDILKSHKLNQLKNITLFCNPLFELDNSNNHIESNKPELNTNISNISLPDLPGTEIECQTLVDFFNEHSYKSQLFSKELATEKNAKSLHSPYILHMATHGFYLNTPIDNEDHTRGLMIKPSYVVNKETNTQILKDSDPMLASGIALAGASSTINSWKNQVALNSDDDGILTAEEVTRLDLDGTWLVTLSACETGVGKVQSGEGVFGLRRAFMMAGAENLLMTLWPVSDEVTPKIMADFYKKAIATGDAAGSLSDVQRDWLVKLRNEKGLLAAVRDAGPFAMVVMANPNAKPSSSDTKPEKAPVPTTSVNTESTDATVSEAGNSHGCKILEFQEALTKADGGDPYAEAIVSIYYGLGYKTDKDTAKAVEYASKSAKQENPLGIYVLGSLTAQGDGVEKDPDKGRDLKIKAIEGLNTMTNDPYALSSLGAMALRGEGLSKDLKKAALLYKQSADLGYAPAQFIYAIMLSKGAGVSRNDKKAAQYMQKAQSQNFNVK
jgi:CHAT domain-containing protein